MNELEEGVSRALADGGFYEALALLGFGDSYLKNVTQGPPPIPAFSRKNKPRPTVVPPSRPKIYGPPPFPAFQHRNLQTKWRQDPNELKPDPAFLKYSQEISRTPTPGVPLYYHLIHPNRFFPNIVLVDPSSFSSEYVQQQHVSENTTSKLTALESDDHSPEDSKDLPLEVLKAVESKVSAPSSEFMYMSENGVESESDEKSVEAVLSTSPTSSGDSVMGSGDAMSNPSSLGLLPSEALRSSACLLISQRDQKDVVEATVEDQQLSVMFSTDTFNDSSASSCQEICLMCNKTENKASTYSDTALPSALSSNAVSTSGWSCDAMLPAAVDAVLPQKWSSEHSVKLSQVS